MLITGRYFYLGKINGRLHCWTKQRQDDGKFWVWTVNACGREERLVKCVKRYNAKAKAHARFQSDQRPKPISIGYIPKNPFNRVVVFKKYAEICREKGKNEEAANWEIKAAAQELENRENPPVKPIVKSKKEIEIEKTEAALKRWHKKSKLACTKIKILTRKLRALGDSL